MVNMLCQALILFNENGIMSLSIYGGTFQKYLFMGTEMEDSMTLN